MNDPKATASVRAVAAEKLLDRAYGKPPQLNTPLADEFRRTADITDAAGARAARSIMSSSSVGERTVEPTDARIAGSLGVPPSLACSRCCGAACGCG